jgi:hypothetical protein
LKFETNSKIVKASLRSFDIIKFRFALNINFDRKYCEARSFDFKSRDESFDSAKFRFALNVNFDRKYYKSTSRDRNSRMSNQKKRKKKSIKDKKKLLIFSRKINNSLSFSTTMKITRMIKWKFVKHVKIFSLSINMMRDEKIKLFKKMILWHSFKFCELYSKSKCTRFINERIKKLSSTIFAFLTISNQTMMFREEKTSSKRKNISRISSINLLSFSFQNFLSWQKKRD